MKKGGEKQGGKVRRRERQRKEEKGGEKCMPEKLCTQTDKNSK